MYSLKTMGVAVGVAVGVGTIDMHHDTRLPLTATPKDHSPGGCTAFPE